MLKNWSPAVKIFGRALTGVSLTALAYVASEKDIRDNKRYDY